MVSVIILSASSRPIIPFSTASSKPRKIPRLAAISADSKSGSLLDRSWKSATRAKVETLSISFVCLSVSEPLILMALSPRQKNLQFSPQSIAKASVVAGRGETECFSKLFA